ncbi:hypothetical protein [Pseudomonas brassicacearum]|uniref:hypothetical protein n=1 Tax=Pseudomonas brassicacearum TaxID=930166 RepID=UPI0011836CC1|nr:hypothetical protein [Pseudomonas brassicacearum]
MSNGITLPPIIITPDYLLPKPPVLPPTYTGKPLPWNGKIIALTSLDNFFSQKNIRSDRYTMTVVTIVSAHRSVEQSYLAYHQNTSAAK